MKIILERVLDFNQFKNVFILNFICFFIFIIFLKSESNYIIFFFRLLFGIVILACVLTMLLKKGIVIEKKLIYVAYFLFGIKVFKNKLEAENMKILRLFKFTKSSSFNYPKRHPKNVTHWEPNLNYQTHSFQLFLLNENQTNKVKILSLVKEQNSTNAIEFILKNTEVIMYQN